MRIFSIPMFSYTARFIRNLYLEYKYRSCHLSVSGSASIWNSKFGRYNSFGDNTYLYDSIIGDFSYIADNSRIFRTEIGKFCSIGPNVLMGLGKHPSRDFVSTHPAFFSNRKQSGISFIKKNLYKEFESIVIGNDVWVGARSIILDGVKIGDGVIVASGSVVTKNIPSYSVVGGVPAKIIRYRFTKKHIDFLGKLKWWNKDTRWLRRNAQKFIDVELFCKSLLK